MRAIDKILIFIGLVMWIVSTSAAAQRVRANLYGALLNYLRIGKVTIPKRNSDEERLKKANLEVLLGYGDAFLDIVCRDSVSGHEIRMMLALSVLDELLCLENRGSWLYYLTRQGYLRHIIGEKEIHFHGFFLRIRSVMFQRILILKLSL